MKLGPVVILCSKGDYFLARICAASIRYYYPDIDLYIVKDYLNGAVDSRELEEAFNVKELFLDTKHFGWGTSKIFFTISKHFPGEKVLLLDPDIVFAGRVLEPLYEYAAHYDFVICPEPHDEPYSSFVTRNYYDYAKLKEIDPAFNHPGYFFNMGQILVSTGKVSREDLQPWFNADEMPYCRHLDIMPYMDQSRFNYLLPKMHDEGRLKLGTYPFMKWINYEEVQHLDLEKVKEGSAYPFLIHWAGVFRSPFIEKMQLPGILKFFENYYYARIPMGAFKRNIRKAGPAGQYYARSFYTNGIKKLIRK